MSRSRDPSPARPFNTIALRLKTKRAHGAQELQRLRDIVNGNQPEPTAPGDDPQVAQPQETKSDDISTPVPRVAAGVYVPKEVSGSIRAASYLAMQGKMATEDDIAKAAGGKHDPEEVRASYKQMLSYSGYDPAPPQVYEFTDKLLANLDVVDVCCGDGRLSRTSARRICVDVHTMRMGLCGGKMTSLCDARTTVIRANFMEYVPPQGYTVVCNPPFQLGVWPLATWASTFTNDLYLLLPEKLAVDMYKYNFHPILKTVITVGKKAPYQERDSMTIPVQLLERKVHLVDGLEDDWEAYAKRQDAIADQKKAMERPVRRTRERIEQ